MSEEDSINSDNAEDHGLEVFETSTGDRCFLNPGNDFVYGRDGTFLGTRQEMEPHKERQRVIITRLNRWLTMPSDGTHTVLEEMHDYRLKDFFNIITYMAVEVALVIFLVEYVPELSLHYLILFLFLGSTLTEVLKEYVEKPVEENVWFFLAELLKKMRTNYYSSMKKEFLFNCILLSIMICLQGVLHLLLSMSLRIVILCPFFLLSLGKKLVRNLFKQIFFLLIPFVVLVDIMTDTLFGYPISALVIGPRIYKRKRYYDFAETENYSTDLHKFNMLYRKNRMINVLQAYPCMLGHLVTIGTNSVLIHWKILQHTALFIWKEILVKVYGVFVEHVVIDFLHVGELVWDDNENVNYTVDKDGVRHYFTVNEDDGTRHEEHPRYRNYEKEKYVKFADKIRFRMMFSPVASWLYMLEDKVNIIYEHLIVRGIPFITMCNCLTTFAYVFYYFGWTGLVCGLLSLLGLSAITTLQYLTFFEWIWHHLSHLVLFCYPVENRESWRDPRDHITNLLSVVYVFFLVLPFCIVFKTSFNAMSHVFCHVSNVIIHEIYGSADDTCTISMYSVLIVSFQASNVLWNVYFVWCLFIDIINVLKGNSIFEILGLILMSLFLFGISFGFGNYLLHLSKMYVLIIPYLLYQYKIVLEQNRQDMKDLYGSEDHPDHPDWVDETW